jgi:uncharacterized membrane protein
MYDVNNSSNRLATIGSILLLIPALNVVGVILVFLGMKGLSKQYNDKRIYSNTAVGTIFGIFGLIAITGLIPTIIISAIFPPASVINIISDTTTVTHQTTYLIVALGVIVSFSLTVLMAIFFRSAFKTLAICSGKRLFRPAGNLLLIGAIVPLLCTALIFVLDRILLITLNTVHVLTTGALAGLIMMCTAFTLMSIAFSSLKQARLTVNNKQ